MSLIGKLLSTLVKRGRLTLILPDGKRETFGPDPDARPITIRFHDRKVAFEIVRNPRLAFGESYMDGRLTVEEGTILDLLELIVGANRWEFGGKGRKMMSTGKMSEIAALFRRNPAAKAKQNVAHHYDLSDDLYDLFLDSDRQYSCAYYTDPGNSLEQAQADKKAHIAAKLDLKPGQRVLD
ncbi:MAG: class I SAM-dependent methyltransferase, partial [Sphingomicrobium sp.]